MTRTLATSDLGTVDAAAWPGLVAGLQAAGAPRLVVARLSGAVITLGRWQRAETVLTPHARALGWRRRVTGGRAWAIGEGMFGVALALPHRAWLVGDAARDLPASKILNRCVRGILDGLGRLGVGAAYFGRDFVTVGSAQAGALSFDADARGHTIVECVLAAETHWSLPENCDALPPAPPQRGVPGPGMVEKLAGVGTRALLEAIAAGHVSRFGCDSFPDATAFAPGTLPADRPSLGGGSRLHAIPIGWCEARVAVGGGTIERVAICGDFLADSAGFEELEEAIVGAAPTLESLAPRMNGVFADAAHTVMGVDDLAVFAGAVVEAAGVAAGSAAGSAEGEES